jgi:PAS domain S-box-containing protein
LSTFAVLKERFHGLKVSQKLALISIFFVMPDSIMLYLFITGINANIQFAKMEQKGNEYQRPLEALLELIPQHRQIARQVRAGEAEAPARLAAKQVEIDSAFDNLEQVDARIGKDLQFTDEGLIKRKREHYRVHTVRGEWQELKDTLAKVDRSVTAPKYVHLVADLRVMITHAGDLSNLILDPDLDSYYLMDATLLALPQNQDRLAAVIDHGETILEKADISTSDRQRLATYATLLKEADLDRIVGSVETALNEDANFYGTNASLQSKVPSLLRDYTTAAAAFIEMTDRLIESTGKAPVTSEEFTRLGNAARDASFRLWQVADAEVDNLLQIRIESFQARRFRSLMVGACALLAAIGFVTFITRSISGPLRQQADKLQSINAALEGEIAERGRAEAALRTAEEKYRGIFENAIEGIFQTTSDGRYLVANPTLAQIYGYASVEELLAGVTNIASSLYVNPHRRTEFRRQIEQHGQLHDFESQIYRKDGSIIWIAESARAAYDANGKFLYYEGTVEDITVRKRSEEELEKLNKQLMETSRQAGMAEVATGVLHNVGNVLNSVNVSTMLISDRLSKSRVTHLSNVSTLLKENSSDLAGFFTANPKGKKLPAFIDTLAERLGVEQGELLREVEGLAKNIAHIKDIVATQQSYAKVSGVTESLSAADLVEDALEMNGAAFERHGVEVERKFTEVPNVRVDKHKVLQVLINLIRNAKYAVSECPRLDKHMSVSIAMSGPDRVQISVVDNGIGIARENLARIFAHGFTTKKDGHGFGLHSSALAAKEIGGSLHAVSEGPGKGAAFILELPADVPQPSELTLKEC